jgi:hypothetical protein
MPYFSIVDLSAPEDPIHPIEDAFNNVLTGAASIDLRISIGYASNMRLDETIHENLRHSRLQRMVARYFVYRLPLPTHSRGSLG